MPLTIFILEDDVVQQKRIGVAVIAETGSHQLFFLDIEIKADKKKGMEVAWEVRRSDHQAVIIFVTTLPVFMPMFHRYRVSDLDFIGKALSEENIALVMTHAHANIIPILYWPTSQATSSSTD